MRYIFGRLNKWDGGNRDANIAKAALTDIRQNVPDLGLMENYKDVFAYSQKGNKEIIFAMRSELKEFDMWNGSFGGNLLPYAATLATYYDASTGEKFDISKENLSGLMRLGIKKTNFSTF